GIRLRALSQSTSMQSEITFSISIRAQIWRSFRHKKTRRGGFFYVSFKRRFAASFYLPRFLAAAPRAGVFAAFLAMTFVAPAFFAAVFLRAGRAAFAAARFSASAARFAVTFSLAAAFFSSFFTCAACFFAAAFSLACFFFSTDFSYLASTCALFLLHLALSAAPAVDKSVSAFFASACARDSP